MTKTTLLLSTLLLLPLASTAQDMCSISLDTVYGAVGGRIPIGPAGVSFRLRGQNLAVNGWEDVRSLGNGFRIYGDDPSVQWNPLDYGYNWDFDDIFDQFFTVYTSSWDGSGADTIGYAGNTMLGMGVPIGWDEEIFWISLSVTDPAAAGHQICLDSSWFPPNGPWGWNYGSPLYWVPPTWDGPHCFEIASCCQGVRGNIDCDPNGEITISDLVYLVTYMFAGGPAPIDMSTADFFDDGAAGIVDLIHLVEYMFRDGPPPPDCP